MSSLSQSCYSKYNNNSIAVLQWNLFIFCALLLSVVTVGMETVEIFLRGVVIIFWIGCVVVIFYWKGNLLQKKRKFRDFLKQPIVILAKHGGTKTKDAFFPTIGSPV